MASVVEICNIALSRLASSSPISSLGERSKAAELCTIFYAQCRDEVLREFPWPFATTAVALADVGSPASGWAFRYSYPADCSLVLGIMQPGQREIIETDQLIPYKVGYSPAGAVIHTDQPQAVACYVARVEDTTLFDPLFVSALAWKLATELAIPITGKREHRQDCEQQYLVSISQAKAQVMNEGQNSPQPPSEYELARQ